LGIERCFMLLLSLAWAVSAYPAHAQAGPEEGLRSCVETADPVARLACFDSFAASLLASASSPRAQGSTAEVVHDADGKILKSRGWLIWRSVDSMTDRPIVVLNLEGVPETGRFVGPTSPSLSLRCSHQKLEAFVALHTFIGSRETYQTRLRFGSAEPITQSWNGSTTGRAIFSPNPSLTTTQLSRVEKLLLEVTSFSGERFRVSFDLLGLDKILPEISACWRPSQPSARPQTTGGGASNSAPSNSNQNPAARPR
jgi:hypothetical protein